MCLLTSKLDASTSSFRIPCEQEPLGVHTLFTLFFAQDVVSLTTVRSFCRKAFAERKKDMKKKIATLLIFALAGSTILGGCGTETSSQSAQENEEEEEIAEAEVSSAEGEDGTTASSSSSEDEEISASTMLESTSYDVTEIVTLPDDYMNMTIELSSNYEVTEEETEEYITNYILAYYPAYAETDKEVVEDGDIVDIDYVGTLDGEEFEGGSAENYDLMIGSGSFIDGFEDGLIDQEVGTTVDLDLTFPEEYANEELAGQDVVFTVTINAIVEQTTITYDELSDEYVESNFGLYGMTTVDDLMADVEETLESMNESYEQSEIQDLILEKLEDESVVDYPEDLLEERYDSYIDQIEEGAEAYGMDYDEYVLAYSGYDDVETFETEALETIRVYLIQELILEAIVADQQISISRSEFDAFVDTYVAYYGFESAEDFYEYYGGEDYVMLSFAENRALNKVADAATILLPEGDSETGEEQAEETEEAEEAVEEKETEEIEDAEEALEEEPLSEDAEEEQEEESLAGDAEEVQEEEALSEETGEAPEEQPAEDNE